MAQVNLTINGKPYGIACDDGQEGRVRELGQYINSRFTDIAEAGAAFNESHLFVLTSLVLADELFELKDGAANQNASATAPVSAAEADQNDQYAKAVAKLAQRVQDIAEKLKNA